MRVQPFPILLTVLTLALPLSAGATVSSHAKGTVAGVSSSSVAIRTTKLVRNRKAAVAVAQAAINAKKAPQKSIVAQVFPIAKAVTNGYLARLTAYWTQEDYWTSRHMSSTGVHLKEGHCAVDPSRIPYGSVVQIPGMGSYLAVDTGSAVVSRQAAKGAAHNGAERNALVVDLFFENREEAERFAAHGPTYAAVVWTKPASTDVALASRAQPVAPVEQPVHTDPFAGPSFADMRLPLNFRSPQM